MKSQCRLREWPAAPAGRRHLRHEPALHIRSRSGPVQTSHPDYAGSGPARRCHHPQLAMARHPCPPAPGVPPQFELGTAQSRITVELIDGVDILHGITWTTRQRAIANGQFEHEVTGTGFTIIYRIPKDQFQIVCMDVRWRLRGKPGVRRSPVQAVGTIAGSCRDIWSRRLGSAAGNPSTGHVGC